MSAAPQSESRTVAGGTLSRIDPRTVAVTETLTELVVDDEPPLRDSTEDQPDRPAR
jgi:hypothetical protein